MSGRPAAALALLLAAAGATAIPLVAQEQAPDRLAAGHAAAAAGDLETAWARYREAYDPAADDVEVLAALAGAAAGLGDLERFRTLADSALASGRERPHALEYWGAAALQTGVPADSVARAYRAYAARHPTDATALGALARVLAGNGAGQAAIDLLESAERGGAGPSAAVALGDIQRAAGRPVAAIEAFLRAVVAGGGPGALALARLDAVLGDWPAGPAAARDAARAIHVARKESVGRKALQADLARLEVAARLAAGDWSGAAALAGDGALDLPQRASALRTVAEAARRAEDLAAARAALETLVALGAPPAMAEDRVRLAEIARALGDEATAREALAEAASSGSPAVAATARAEEVEVARATGDSSAVARAVAEARGSGVGAERIALPLGDLWLARGRPDSALAAYAAGASSAGGAETGPRAVEALGRVRLVQALTRAGTAPGVVRDVGRALVEAPGEPARTAARLTTLADSVGSRDSLGVGRALVRGLAGEWLGRSGDPAGASRALEAAARAAGAGGEAPPLLLAAARWAEEAGEVERARALWRELVLDHGSTPYGLEARRLLAHGSPDGSGG